MELLLLPPIPPRQPQPPRSSETCGCAAALPSAEREVMELCQLLCVMGTGGGDGDVATGGRAGPPCGPWGQGLRDQASMWDRASMWDWASMWDQAPYGNGPPCGTRPWCQASV